MSFIDVYVIRENKLKTNLSWVGMRFRRSFTISF